MKTGEEEERVEEEAEAEEKEVMDEEDGLGVITGTDIASLSSISSSEAQGGRLGLGALSADEGIVTDGKLTVSAPSDSVRLITLAPLGCAAVLS